jgi:hypothetical protein
MSQMDFGHCSLVVASTYLRGGGLVADELESSMLYLYDNGMNQHIF